MPDPRRLRETVEAVRAAGAPVRASAISGVTRARIRAAITGGVLLSLREGIVMPAEDWPSDPVEQHLLRTRAALLAYPGAWASHSTALLVHATDAPALRTAVPTHLHLSRPGTTFRCPGLIVHGQHVPPGSVTSVAGIPCSTLIRASIEVAARRSLGDAVATFDAAMRAAIQAEHADVRYAARDPRTRLRLVDAWDEAIAHYGRHRWVTTVRMALHWANPAAESYLESLSRVAMRRVGMLEPAVGAPLLGDDGVTRWVDFWWQEAGVIGEADGMLKYADREALVAEKLRQEALTGPGRIVVRWGMAQVRPSASTMLDRLTVHLGPPRSISWS